MYVLEEQSDVFVDAAAADHRSQLLFLSAYGRDTSIQQLMARLHQARREGGIEQLTIKRPEGAQAWLPPAPAEHIAASESAPGANLQMFVGDPRRLEKHTGRLPRSLLGNLVHTWIFDSALLEADHATRSGWVFERVASAQALGDVRVSEEARAARRQIADRCWFLVKQLSPIPLLDTWRGALIDPSAETPGLNLTPSQCAGPVYAVRVEIGESFSRHVSEAVRHGVLREDASALPPNRGCVPPAGPRSPILQLVLNPTR